MAHQEYCPFEEINDSARAKSLDRFNVYAAIKQNESLIDLPCKDRRCCVWQDLSLWFGYTRKTLPHNEFQKCFTDIGHGGKGVYEKLSVLGAKSLELLSKLYIAEKFNPINIPFDLNQLIPEEILRRIWAQKRVERVCATRSLSLFAKAYLATSQSINGALAQARYAKALTGYAVQTHAASKSPMLEGRKMELIAAMEDQTVPRTTSIIYDWGTILIDNIYWIQKLKTTAQEEEDELLQDLGEYFGYPYAFIIPRIKSILDHNIEAFDELDFENQVQTGKDLLRLFAVDYFSNAATLDVEELTKWIDTEVQIFMRSKVIALFACTYMNLLPFLEKIQPNVDSLPGSEKHEKLFYQLMAACYTVSKPDVGKKCLSALMFRLRQVQLVIHMEECDIRMNGPIRSPEALFQGVDAFRWSTISKWGHETRKALWAHSNVKPHLRAFVPVSHFRDREKIRNREREIEQKTPSTVTFSDRLLNILHQLIDPHTQHANSPGAPAYHEAALHGSIAKNPNGWGTHNDQAPRIPLKGAQGNYTLAAGFARNTSVAASTNKKGIIVNKFREVQNQKMMEMKERLNGELWRPPLAYFMRPRVVGFRKGEAYVAPHLRHPLPARKQNCDGKVEVHWGPVENKKHRERSICSTCSESLASSANPSGSSESTYAKCSSCSSESSGTVTNSSSVSERLLDKLIYGNNATPAEIAVPRQPAQISLGEDDLLTLQKTDDNIAAEFWRRRNQSLDYESAQANRSTKYEKIADKYDKLLGLHMLKGEKSSSTNRGKRLLVESPNDTHFDVDSTNTKKYGLDGMIERHLSMALP